MVRSRKGEPAAELFSASARPPTPEELEQILAEAPAPSRAQVATTRFYEKVGGFGVVAIFTVLTIAGSEFLTVLLDLVLPINPLSYVLSFVIPLILTPPLTWYTLHLITQATTLHERNLKLAAGFRALAMSDALTGALNRRGLFDWAERADDPPAVIAVVDVDRFKEINDRHGHRVGDAALIAVADLLRGLAGGDGVVARTGGDEFVLAISRPLPDRPQRLRLQSIDVPITLTLGWADYADDIDLTIAHADEAMYLAKATPPADDPRLNETAVPP